jgi:hypothetical protein
MNDAVIENIEFQGELEGKINVGGILGSQNVKARVKKYHCKCINKWL